MRLSHCLWILALFSSTGAQAATGDYLGDLFTPGVNTGSRAHLEERFYQNGYAGGVPYALQQTRFDATTPLYTEPGSSWRGSLFADYDAIQSTAVFSNGRIMPNRLWDPGFAISNTRELSNGQTAGGSLTISSPSDRPFAALREVGFNLNFNYRLPQADGNAWILFLSVSNTRGWANYIPLPGAAYYFHSGKTLQGLVGFPFAMIRWQPVDPWAISLFYFPIRNGELRVTYGHADKVQPYALISYRTRNYALYDRSDFNEHLFFGEALAQAGVIIPIVKGVGLDLGGGQSFARRYFIAERETSWNSVPTIQPDNALFASAKVQAAF